MNTFNSGSLPEYLPQYYKRLFPFKPYVKWLTYGKKASEYFGYREFAFILKDDLHLRYRSFSELSEFEKEVQKVCPYKIDIGAVCNHRPKDHQKYMDFNAKERELVFDIDVTDYDDIRSCCSGGVMCSKCWVLMAVAVRILDAALREDFGFVHILWVYSGRRGVHGWVCDESARQLSPEGRVAVAEYLTVVSGGEQQRKKVSLFGGRLHPWVQRAVELLEPAKDPQHLVDRLVKEQGWLDDSRRWTPILALIPDDKVRQQLEDDFLKMDSGVDRLKTIKFRLQKDSTSNKKLLDLPKNCTWSYEEILLQLAYPRLDINVTKGLNHLLKSPFCIHPKTGRVAVPLNPAQLAQFKPENVPRVDQLLDELSRTKDPLSADGAARKLLDYKRTSLMPFVDLFQDFVEGLVVS